MKINKRNSLLFVDDDRSNLMLLSHMLQDQYTVRVASNGVTALRIAEKYQPDLILLDILMPGLDGYQVFTALQDSPSTMHIPVIFITGLNNRDDEKKGLVMGAVDYISKPFDEMIVKLRIQHQIRIINQLRTIERLSMMDQLTEIPNRRNFDIRLRVEWGRAIRENLPITLLLLDVDHFKNYNDTYGHQQGDQALCLVAKELSQALRRTTDFAARWGGEEFVALLPNTDSIGGGATAERVRQNIESRDIFSENGNLTKLTVSVGQATCNPAPSSQVDELFQNADKALYTAKNSGRNRVCRYE
jgi:diguanylate cyclase (GGDEF)-like protein